MAAIANITLVDAAAANKTYIPVLADGVTAKYVDTNSGPVIGFREVVLKKTAPKDPSEGNVRIRTSNTLPVLNVDGSLKYILASYTDYVIPVQATALERAEIYAREKSLQALTVVKDSVETIILPL